jgi:hypothetical protein
MWQKASSQFRWTQCFYAGDEGNGHGTAGGAQPEREAVRSERRGRRCTGPVRALPAPMFEALANPQRLGPADSVPFSLGSSC